MPFFFTIQHVILYYTIIAPGVKETRCGVICEKSLATHCYLVTMSHHSRKGSPCLMTMAALASNRWRNEYAVSMSALTGTHLMLFIFYLVIYIYGYIHIIIYYIHNMYTTIHIYIYIYIYILFYQHNWSLVMSSLWGSLTFRGLFRRAGSLRGWSAYRRSCRNTDTVDVWICLEKYI